MFFITGLAKLSGDEQMIEVFAAIGIGQWLRYVTGLIEFASAIFLLIPALSGVGALLLVPTMLGAILTYLLIIDGSLALPIGLLIVVSVVAWGRKETFLRLISHSRSKESKSNWTVMIQPKRISTSDLVRCFYEEIWNRGNQAKIPELLHESFTFRGSLGQTKRGRDAFAGYVEFVRDALAEYRCGIQEMVCEGNKVFAKVLFSGVHQKEFLGYPATFRRVEWIGAALFRVDGNKFSDVWVLGDLDALREQLSGGNK